MNTKAYKQMYELEETHWWFVAKRRFIKAVLPQSKKRWKILDIGPGTGGLTQFLSQWGEVTGVEKSPTAAKYLTKRKIKFIQHDVLEYTAPPASYDLICLLDVLYHHDIRNDTLVLEKAYLWLRPGGYLCITDSALPLLFSHHDVIMKTRERYYLRSLAQKVIDAGFVVKKKSYIYFFVFPIIAIVRAVNKFIPFESVGTVPVPLNTFLKFVCFLEARLVPFIEFPVGSSILIFAQKNPVKWNS